MSRREKAVRAKLQAALDALPEWSPDNSAFNGEPDSQTKAYLKKYGVRSVKIDLGG